ncbi:hypothetical protein CBR_g3619 [Chara braunii]|uniref:GIY-YIG domain-containing protein n=1 Tax=Chara braunii TaxID=69332 RepID=A0A388KFT8_CHABU|nr:hypothetical protein CBR_g3619 [Chara braunii]|eukprot:GBG68920.1 hypothetical protein CBR_g3619 [Chara braunii]
MKSFIDVEEARKAEVEKAKSEKEKLKQEKKEQARKEEEERLEKERRAKKEVKKRKEEELREGMQKDLHTEIRMHVGGMCEELQHRLLGQVQTGSKGKVKLPSYTSDVESYESGNSDVETLSEQTGRLNITEKRKRSAEKVVGDSPPMETPTKRTAKRGVLNPKRLLLSCRLQAMKKTPKKSPIPSILKKKKKIPTESGSIGKLRYVTDNLCELGYLNVDELKQVCRAKDVPYEGKKMETILAIAEMRTQVAYGPDKEEREPIEGIQQQTEVEETDEGIGSEKDEETCSVHQLWRTCKALLSVRRIGQYDAVIEVVYRLVVVRLALHDQILWLRKCVNSWVSLYQRFGVVAFSGTIGGIYVLASPICRAQYVGQTSRDGTTRWKEHLSVCRRGRKQTHLYRWWQVLGIESYLLLPVDMCRTEELPTLEQLYIQRWNPVFNTRGMRDKGSSKTKRLRGKRERSKQAHSLRCATQSTEVLPVKVSLGSQDDRRVDIFDVFKTQDEKDCLKFTVRTQRGNCSCGGWKPIKSAFGNSVVKVKGQKKKLSECKKLMEEGGVLSIEQLRRWVPKAGPDKKFLRSLFQNPQRMEALKNCNLEALTRLMKAAADFQKASTTTYLRRIVARAIKEVYGWSINAKMVVRLKFDDRIRLVDVRKVVNDAIEGMEIPNYLKDVARGVVRIV